MVANSFPDGFLSSVVKNAQKQSLGNRGRSHHVAVEAAETRLPKESVEKAGAQRCLFTAVTGARCAALDSLERLHQ